MRNFIIGALFLFTEVSAACQCQSVPLSSKVSSADYIYLGVNIQASLMANGKVENTMKPIEILKGTPDQWKLLSNGGPIHMCSSIAAVGLQYVVYGKYGKIPKLSLCGSSYHYDPANSIKLSEIRETANK